MAFIATIALATLLLAVPATDASAARARDKLPTGTVDSLDLPAFNATVERVQRALTKAGYYSAAINGRFDEETGRAIRNYQRREGLPQNGIASTGLATHIETSAKVQSLLKQLRLQRQSKMKQARKALLARPETRDLISGPKKRGKADASGRDAAHCFLDPTPKCLLEEAVESAIAIFKSEHRDWALGEILVAEAKAGLVAEAMETVRQIGDPRLIMVALRDIAKAQAAAGRPVEALSAADIIPDVAKRLEALAAIATILAARGDQQGAGGAARSLLDGLEQIDAPLKRISLAARAITALARSGNTGQAEKELSKILLAAKTETTPGQRSAALRHVANAYAETGRPEKALAVIKNLPDASEHTPVLVSAATAQARAGDAQLAITTAQSIEAIRYRAVVLSRIAIAQAKAGNAAGGQETLEKALAAAAEIKRPYARAYAYERISFAMMEVGPVGDVEFSNLVINTVNQISDDKLRAHTLWSLTTRQKSAGDDAAAIQSEALAEKATAAIKSPLTRVWMFCEISLQHLSKDREPAAWGAFMRALTITRDISSVWGRSRALARLASTLIELPQGVKKE